MKVEPVILNTQDTGGGAAIACYRLHKGFCEAGIKSKMLVQDKFSNDDSVISINHKLYNKFRRRIDYLPLYFYPNRTESPFNIQWLSCNYFNDLSNNIEHDIIHLHWIGNGFISIEQLSNFNKPVVWTLHDSWAFTGGCHIPYTCEKYKISCSKCPELGSNKKNDLSKKIWNRKKQSWAKTMFTLVSPSNWLAENARSSALLGHHRIEVIPNGINLETFKVTDKKEAKQKLNLAPDKRYILFGAFRGVSDPNKGINTILSVAKYFKEKENNVELLLFGSQHIPMDGISIPMNNLGVLNDESMISLAYSAADVLVVPSRSENLPNTIIEALACGTPSVAYNVGGIPDIIDHGINGFLARPYKIDELVNGVIYILKNPAKVNFSDNCRNKATLKFDIKKTVQSYLSLYEDVLNSSLATH